MMKKLVATLLIACWGSGAMAVEEDAAIAFREAIDKYEGFFHKEENCEQTLRQSWDSFSTDYGYRETEERYMQGAMRASLCGMRRGYMLYLLLGDFESAVKAGVVKRQGFNAAVQQAMQAFYKRPDADFNAFYPSISCNASTPRVTFSGTYSNVVNIRCTTNRGPAKVDLRSMRIDIGGKEVWNGPNSEYFGRSIAKALRSQ